jgi:hypothetical protein
VKKQPDEGQYEVHILVVDDQDHPEIHAELIELWSRGVYLGMCLGRKIRLNHVEDKGFSIGSP